MTPIAEESTQIQLVDLLEDEPQIEMRVTHLGKIELALEKKTPKNSKHQKYAEQLCGYNYTFTSDG
jgi:hypothetical protein